MEVTFSKHAIDRLGIRENIKKRMVLETINSPDEISPSFRGRRLYRKVYNNRILEIVAKEEDNILIVITQYLLERKP